MFVLAMLQAAGIRCYVSDGQTLHPFNLAYWLDQRQRYGRVERRQRTARRLSGRAA